MQARLQEIKKKIKWWEDRSISLKVTFETGKIDDAYADIKFLLDALEQSQDKERVLRDAVNSLIGLCENVGDFSNGNTYNEIDEGNVMAERFIDHIKSNIKALEDKPNDQLKQTNENIQQ